MAVKSELTAKLRAIIQKYNGDASTSLKAHIIEAASVQVLAISDDNYLLLVDFADSANVEANIKRLVETGIRKSIVFGTTKPLKMFQNELIFYLRGQLIQFNTPIKLVRNDTDFRLAVWQQIAAIPFGETKSYADLAKAIGKPSAYRAVANACGRNPLTIIVPCHRVTASNNGLGGFSSGIEKKKLLLKIEGKLV